MTLLDLPNELIIQILSNLTHNDLISCQLSNNTLCTIIKDSVLLQLRIALSTFKATDNPSCSLSVSERLKALKDSEEAWSLLRTDFKRRIAVDFEESGIYDLSSGVFLLGNATRTALHYIKLPSSSEDNVDWKKIQLDDNEGMIIDMGFCLYEHDLLAVVTTKPCPGATTYDIKLVLFKTSTGEPHPAAKESTIHVLNSQWEKPGISLEIVGDHLVLILTYHNIRAMPYDRIFVYDWRNGIQKMSFSAPYCSYNGIVFLSENLFLMPNARTNALEIWDILSTSKSPRPDCILQLPEIATGNSLSYITCRGEPNPIGSGSNRQTDSPFYQSSNDAIVLFHIYVQLADPVDHQLQHGGGFAFEYSYKLFVHRKALNAVYERWCAERNSKSRDTLGVVDQVRLEDSALNDTVLEYSALEEFAMEDDYSELEMIVEDDEDDDEHDVVIRVTNDDPIPMPWFSWGPPITRWFPADNNSTRWITTTAGQRGVVIRQPRPGTGCQYVVLDFNPDNIRRAEKKLESSALIKMGTKGRIQSFRNWEGLKPEGVFKDTVIGELPFMVCTSEKSYVWDGVLMDEERILGLQIENGGHIRAIEVHHFGGGDAATFTCRRSVFAMFKRLFSITYWKDR